MKKIYVFKDKYYIKGEKICCDNCKQQQQYLDTMVIIERYSRKKKSQIQFYCIDCSHKYKQEEELESIKIAIIVENLPYHAIQYIPTPPDLREGRVRDTFSAAYIPTDVTIDRTVHAGRFSLEGAQIGDTTLIDKKDEADKLIGRQGADALKGFLKGLKPATDDEIEYQKKKQIR